jgi:hypothetical protein
MLFADTWPTCSCSHRNFIYLIVGENDYFFAQRSRTFLYAHDVLQHFIRQEAETWQPVFSIRVGKGGGEINATGSFEYLPRIYCITQAMNLYYSMTAFFMKCVSAHFPVIFSNNCSDISSHIFTGIAIIAN